MNSSGLVFLCCSAQAAINLVYKRDRKWRPWTQAEDNIVRLFYVKRGPRFCRTFLRHRTINSICHRARQLNSIKWSCDHWTDAEIQILIDGITRDRKIYEISEALLERGYNRSHSAIRDFRREIRSHYFKPVAYTQDRIGV